MLKEKPYVHFTLSCRVRGQSFVEMAILFPLLLIMVSGMVEFGFLLNQYLAILDAARNASRFSSDSLYYVQDTSNQNCDPQMGEVTNDFYFQTACVAIQELAQERPTIEIDPDRGDDIIISAFTVTGGAQPSVTRHFSPSGWSYTEAKLGRRNQISSFTDQDVVARLQSGAPSTGVVIVEIYYHYDQVLGLPWITAFLNNPLTLHSYTFMPLVSAEPTPIVSQ